MEDYKPCLCCSGKLYKDCCKKKIAIANKESAYKAFISEFDKLHNGYKKICMHPMQDECSSTKTHAHTISQKAVLELIADQKKVLMPIEFGISKTFKMHPTPIEARATKFYCFCSKHDGIFAPIDKQEVEFTDQNCFLYAYRTFAYTFYKIERELYCYNRLKEKYDLTVNPIAIVTFIGMEHNIHKMGYWKEKFDDALKENRYDSLESVQVELDYKVYFAAATCFCPMIDLYGNELPWDDENLPLVYISIIPNENNTKIIFSWFKECNIWYRGLKNQISIVPTRLLLKYLNNLLPLNCENMTVGPKLWEQWGKKGQNDFISIASGHLSNDNMKYESSTYFKEREFDLFERI